MNKPIEECMSAWVVSDKDKAWRRGSPDYLYNIQLNSSSIRCQTNRPWVAILLDLGTSQSKVSSTWDPPRAGKRKCPPFPGCLRIYASGLTSKIFPFLTEQLESRMRAILPVKPGLGTTYPLAGAVNQAHQYGATPKDSNLG